jgi:hypothetical protein
LSGENAAVADEKVGDVVRESEAVDYAASRIFTHPRGTDQMRVPRLLDNFHCPGGSHHLLNFVFAEFDQLFVIVMELKINPSHPESKLVGFLRQSNAIVRPGQDFTEQTNGYSPS